MAEESKNPGIHQMLQQIGASLQKLSESDKTGDLLKNLYTMVVATYHTAEQSRVAIGDVGRVVESNTSTPQAVSQNQVVQAPPVLPSIPAMQVSPPEVQTPSTAIQPQTSSQTEATAIMQMLASMDAKLDAILSKESPEPAPEGTLG